MHHFRMFASYSKRSKGLQSTNSTDSTNFGENPMRYMVMITFPAWSGV